MLIPIFDRTFSEKLLSNQKIEGQCRSPAAYIVSPSEFLAENCRLNGNKIQNDKCAIKYLFTTLQAEGITLVQFLVTYLTSSLNAIIANHLLSHDLHNRGRDP